MLRVVLIAAVLATVPSLAWANAGTPLMWAGMLYLCGGNVLLGVAEGFVLAKWFDLSVKRCIGWMIAANLLSAWVGQIFLTGVFLLPFRSLWEDFTNLGLFLIAALFAAWIATLIIEWPFIFLCFRGETRRIARSLLATAVIQTASCVVLGVFFFMASFFSLVTDHRIVPPDEIPWPAGLMVYYFDQDGKTIRAFDTDTGETHSFHVLGNRHRPISSAVFFGKDPTLPESMIHPLVAGEFGPSHLHDHDVEELGVLVDTAGIERVTQTGYFSDPENSRTRFPFGTDWHPYWDNPISIVPRHPDLHYLRQGFWAAEGLAYRFGNKEDSNIRRLSLETPFITLYVRQVMALGDSLVLFQFGDNQICLLDMRTQRVAMKLRGFGPMAVPKEAIVEKSDPASPAAMPVPEGQK